MRLLITDVTEMRGGNYCVAGWCAETVSMVRPLPNGENWTATLLAQHGVVPGTTLSVRSIGMRPSGAYPHRTEDTPVDPASVRRLSAGPEPWFGPNTPPTAKTLAEAFEGNVCHNREWNGYRQGVYVPVGTQTRSLYAVRVDSGGLTLFEDDDKKLRAYMDDGSQRYNLPVPSKQLKELHRGGAGLGGVTALLPKSGTLHIRVGLAREWKEKHPNKCFVMINGVFW